LPPPEIIIPSITNHVPFVNTGLVSGSASVEVAIPWKLLRVGMVEGLISVRKKSMGLRFNKHK